MCLTWVPPNSFGAHQPLSAFLLPFQRRVDGVSSGPDSLPGADAAASIIPLARIAVKRFGSVLV